MKARKEPVWRKHRIHREKGKEKCIGMSATIAVLTAIIIVSCFLINSILNQPSKSHQAISILEPKAAIVDHLSLTYPDETFIQTATNTLEQAGYTVSYYPFDKVTVEFYKNLPSHSYSLLVLRVHSATDPRRQWVGLFSSEPYSKAKYVYEQLTDQVSPASINHPPNEGESIYFGIHRFSSRTA